MEIEAGHRLIQQGDPADDLFLIDTGQVSVQLEIDQNRTVRLRKMCAGTIVGELGMILEEPRTASIVSKRPSKIYRLSREALQRIEREEPQLALAFHRHLTYLVAGRLAESTRTIRTILD